MQALRDVGVVRGAVALQDPGARGALAALHGHEVLEGHRDAGERVQLVHGRGAGGAGGGEACVRGIGLGEGTLVIDGQPRVEAVIRAAGALEVGRRQLA